MSNVFKEQTPEKFDDEKIHELFPVEELEEALAQIERGEVYTMEEVEALFCSFPPASGGGNN